MVDSPGSPDEPQKGSPDEPQKGERTRAALLEAAIERFAVNGFTRTTVADIAQDIRMTPGTPYRYFASKDALFSAAVNTDAAELIDDVRNHIFGHMELPVRDLLASLNDQLSLALDDHRLVARVLRGTEPLRPDEMLALGDMTRLRTEITALLSLGQEEGAVRPNIDPALVALGIETAVFCHLTYLATLRGSDQAATLDRWVAIATLIDAALQTCPRARG